MFPVILLLISTVGGSRSHVKNLPHGHDLHELVDAGFKTIDLDGNGIVPLSEFQTAMNHMDADNDGYISEAEYMVSSTSAELATLLFQYFDADDDGLIPLTYVPTIFHSMDHNGDGRVNLNEFEHYYVKIIHEVTAHGHH